MRLLRDPFFRVSGAKFVFGLGCGLWLCDLSFRRALQRVDHLGGWGTSRLPRGIRTRCAASRGKRNALVAADFL